MTKDEILKRLFELRDQQIAITDELRKLREELHKILKEEEHGA